MGCHKRGNKCKELCMECALITQSNSRGHFREKLALHSHHYSKPGKKPQAKYLGKYCSNKLRSWGKKQQIFSPLQTPLFSSCSSPLNESLRILGKYILKQCWIPKDLVVEEFIARPPPTSPPYSSKTTSSNNNLCPHRGHLSPSMSPPSKINDLVRGWGITRFKLPWLMVPAL